MEKIIFKCLFKEHKGLIVYHFLKPFFFLKIKKNKENIETMFGSFFFNSEKHEKYRKQIQITIIVFRKHQNCILYVFKNFFYEQFSKRGTKQALGDF